MTVRNCCASRLAKSKQQVELRGKKRRFWTKVIFFASFQIQDGGVGTTLFNIDTGYKDTFSNDRKYLEYFFGNKTFISLNKYLIKVFKEKAPL